MLFQGVHLYIQSLQRPKGEPVGCFRAASTRATQYFSRTIEAANVRTPVLQGQSPVWSGTSAPEVGDVLSVADPPAKSAASRMGHPTVLKVGVESKRDLWRWTLDALCFLRVDRKGLTWCDCHLVDPGVCVTRWNVTVDPEDLWSWWQR